MKNLTGYAALSCLFLALSACGTHSDSGGHSAARQELKAQNDASQKASVDAFMEVDHRFNVLADTDDQLTNSIDFKTFTNDTFDLQVEFKDGAVIHSTGKIKRNYDSDKSFDSIYLDDSGSMQIYTKSQEPKTYCPVLTIPHGSKDFKPVRIHACENQAAKK